MFLRQLTLAGFRNLGRLSLEPCDGLNVIHGPNAQGKTNLLEAIALLTSHSSFRSVTLRDMIQVGEQQSQLTARVESQGISKKVQLHLKEGSKTYQLDDTAVRSARNLRKHVRAVTFTGDDLRLITGSPSRRRRYLDQSISSITPDYPDLVKDYSRSLAQKNAVITSRNPDTTLLDVWNERLARSGARITAARVRYLRYIEPQVSSLFRSISDMEISVELRYQSSATVDEPKIAVIEAELIRLFEINRREEVARKATLVGPHRDDLLVKLDGHPAHRYGSQGQLRMLAMSLKLAELWSLTDQMGLAPIFLIDDVSTELDEQRNCHLMTTLRDTGCQVFVTTTSPDNVPTKAWADFRFFRLDEGQIRP